MTRRHFAMVTTFYPPFNFGGDGIFVRRLSNALAARGHRVDVFHHPAAFEALAGGPPPDPSYRDHEAVRHFPLLRGRWSKLDLLVSHQLGRPVGIREELCRRLEESRPDVIHFHNVSLLGGPAVLTAGRGVKLCTLHDYWFVCPMHTLWRYGQEACTRTTCWRCVLRGRRIPQLWRSGALTQRAAAAVDLFLAPSRFSEATHRERGFAGRLARLAHFVPRQDSVAMENAPASGRPYFLFAGRLEKLKGAADLLEAFRGFEEAELWLAGSGSERQVLESLAAEIPNVRLLGWTDEERLRVLTRGATAVLIPSRCYETFGLVGAEAFAVGTPVIARRIGALTELVEEGGGVLYESPEELRRAMVGLLADPERAARLARQGREAYERRYSEEAHVQRYLRFIAEIECGRAGRGAG